MVRLRSPQVVRFIHTADWHVGVENYSRIDPQTGLSTRLEDFLSSIDFIVDFALEKRVDFVLFAGDAYKTREPSPTHQRELAKRVLRLTKERIPFVCLVGNHDTPGAFGKANSLDIYSTLELENVFVIREPQVIKLKGVQILGIPWLSRDRFERVGEIFSSLSKEIQVNLPLIVSAHATVEGAVFGSERSVSLGRDFVVPKKLLISHPQTAYVALGHIHKRQIIYENSIPLVYSGSIERVDFGEEKEEKSFEFVEIRESKGKFRATYHPVPTPARKFLTIKVSISLSDNSPTETILQEISRHDFKDKVVKVVVDFPPDSNQDIRVQDVKKSLDKAFIVAAINKNVERTARTQLGEGVQAEQLTPLELLETYFKNKGYSEPKIKILKDYATKLMEIRNL